MTFFFVRFFFLLLLTLSRYVHLWMIWHGTICGLIGQLIECINRFIGLALCSQFDFYGLSHIKWFCFFVSSIYANWFAIYSISCALLTIFCLKCIIILWFVFRPLSSLMTRLNELIETETNERQKIEKKKPLGLGNGFWLWWTNPLILPIIECCFTILIRG